MNIVTFLIAQTQSSLIEQPIERCLEHIAGPAKAATVFSIAFGYRRFGLTPRQRLANLVLGIIGAVRKYFVRTFARAASWLLDRRNAIDRRDGHFRIINICTGMRDSRRSGSTIKNQMVFGAIFALIRGIGAGFRPPKRARTEQLSIAEQDQSMASAGPNSSSKGCHIFCQTPATCQSRRRGQQVMPLPQPISWASYCDGVPVLSTNRMPVRQAWWGTRARPPLGFGGSDGMWGLMCCDSSSVSSGLAIVRSSMTSGYSVRIRCHIGETSAQSLGFVKVP